MIIMIIMIMLRLEQKWKIVVLLIKKVIIVKVLGY
jgi:hypothetical protein